MFDPEEGNPTGYEDKPLKVVIQNWLYLDPDPSLQSMEAYWAEVEMRRRLTKTFPRPEWLPEHRS